MKIFLMSVRSPILAHSGAGAAVPAARSRRRARRGGWRVRGLSRGTGMLRVEELDRLLVDLHVLAIGDGRRLGRAHQMAPAPRQPRGVKLLERGLVVLEGVHLGEVGGHDERGETADERGRVVPEVYLLVWE